MKVQVVASFSAWIGVFSSEEGLYSGCFSRIWSELSEMLIIPVVLILMRMAQISMMLAILFSI